MSGVFSIAAHSMLQNLPDVAWHEQMGCAHLAGLAAFTMAVLLLFSISFPPASDQLRVLSFDSFGSVELQLRELRYSFPLGQRRLERRWGTRLEGRTGNFRVRDEFVKQRPIMNHCLTQIFRACLTPRLAKGGLVCRTVMVQNQRVVHRDVRRALLKIAHGITPRGHHIAQQLVGFGYSSARSIHESCLNSVPRLNEPRAIRRSEGPDVQTFHALGPLVERVS